MVLGFASDRHRPTAFARRSRDMPPVRPRPVRARRCRPTVAGLSVLVLMAVLERSYPLAAAESQATRGSSLPGAIVSLSVAPGSSESRGELARQQPVVTGHTA